MADTTLRFEFVEGQAAGSSGKTSSGSGSAAKSRDGLGELLDKVSGGASGKLRSFVDGVKQKISAVSDLFGKISGRAAGTAAQAAAGATSTATSGAAAAGLGEAGAGAAAGALGGPVGIAIVAGLAATVYTTKLLVDVNNKLRERFGEVAERIKDFSPALQAVSAINEAEVLRYRVGLAARDGGSYASFQRTQNQLDQSLTRLGDAISGLGLDTLGPIAEALAIEAGAMAEVLAGGVEAVRMVNSSMKPLTDGVLAALKMLRGQRNRDDLKLPPEADILGLFAKKPDLSVEWNGRIYSGDSSKMIASGAPVFKDPLPTLGLP